MVITGNYVHRRIVLLPGNIKLSYTLCLDFVHIDLFTDSNLFKCLITIKRSESRIETLQISGVSSLICEIHTYRRISIILCEIFKNLIKS